MIVVKPFRAVRPVRDKVHLIPSRNFISYNKKDLAEKLNGNPYTFIHVINPEFGSAVKTKPNSKARFLKVKEKFAWFRNQNYFVKDASPLFYLYQQTVNNRTFTGIIGAISVDNYFSGEIKVHEHTLSAREEIFAKYLETTAFNAEPVLLMHQPNQVLTDLYNRYAQTRPEYDYTTTDTIRHTLWLIDKAADIKTISAQFSKIPAVYIADGHHRTASSAKLAQMLRKADKNPHPDKAYNYCLAFLINEEQLEIKGFHRLVKDLNGLSLTQFTEKLHTCFTVEPTDAYTKPSNKHNFILYCHKSWFSITLKPEKAVFTTPDKALDAQILTDFILEPILAIEDLKTNKRVSFAGGNISASHIVKDIDKGNFEAAFFLYPVEAADIKTVSDNNLIMPPKSTWIEPKLRSGLTILPLNDD
ncbi:MAG: DUF1015 domain-containing protein [Luteibaculaceae bacterium]